MPLLKQLTINLWLHVALACCALVPAVSHADQQDAGYAAVTSARGEVWMVRADGATIQPKVRKLLQLSEGTIHTHAAAQLVLSLSNGIGITLAENTSLTVDRYTQAAFSKRKEGLQFEPSTSNLQLDLKSGLIGIAFEHLSPLSTANLQLPMGDLKIHSGKLLVGVDDNESCSISVLSGTATLQYANDEKREFLAAGQTLCISGVTATPVHAAELSTDQLELVESANHARTRVLFQGGLAEQGPSAIWIRPIDQLEKPAERPYSFKL